MLAALDAGVELKALLISSDKDEIGRIVRRAGTQPVVLPHKVLASIVDADTPQGIAAEIEIPRRAIDKNRDCAFLEAIQDAGNVGAIVRSAAAFGIGTLYLGKGCADPWSPKVLRAGAGGHFAVALVESEEVHGKTVCTVPSGGSPLRELKLGGAACWIFGSEGAGVSAARKESADYRVTIPMTPGAESLNVAAAAAICFYERFSRRAPGS